jgi:hypothetical protein
MHHRFRMPWPRASAVRRVSLALAVSAAWLAGVPAAGQRRGAPEEVPIVMPRIVDFVEYERLRVELFPSAAREAGLTNGSAAPRRSHGYDADPLRQGGPGEVIPVGGS